MSERNHSLPDVTAPAIGANPPSKWLPLIVGSVVVVLASGVMFQIFRPDSTIAVESGGKTTTKSVSSVTEKTLAIVNKQAIQYDAVAAESVARHGAEVLDGMINRLLIQQEIEKRHLEVTEAEVHQEVESVAKKFKIPLDSWYKMLQAERGLSPRQYHEEIIWPMLALKKLAGADINVTERELQRAFERDYGPRVQARMAVLDGNIRQCEEIWRRFDANPDDFERLTREYSSDSNSRALGGAIPPIRKHSDNAKLVETAFRMNEGEVSPLIEIAPNKYCVIKCEGRTQQVVQNLDQVRKELMEQLVDEKTQDSVSDIFKKIRENSQVTNYLTGSSTTPSVSNPIRQTSGTQPGKRAASVVP